MLPKTESTKKRTPKLERPFPWRCRQCGEEKASVLKKYVAIGLYKIGV